MAVEQSTKVLIVNNAHTAALTERTRTTSRGTSQRFTLDIQQEAIGVNLDEIALGREIAKAIAAAVADGIKNIAQGASIATKLRRKAAAIAYGKGEPWARDRYDPPGNRMGAMPPDRGTTGTLFTDSGRFAQGIVSTPTRDGTYTINVPKGRLDPTTFKSNGRFTFEMMVTRLFELVDVLRDPASLVQHPAVQAAMEQTAAKMAVKLGKGAMEVGKALAELARTAGETGDALEGLQ